MVWKRREGEEQHGGKDVEKAEDEAERAAEAADDFAGVFLLEIWVESAESDGEAVEGESHERDDGGEVQGAGPGHFEHVTGEDDQADGDDEGGEGGLPEFCGHDLPQSERCHADDPEPFAFEGELWVNEPGGERGEVE